MVGLRKQDMNVYQRFNMMREIATKLVKTTPNPTMEDVRNISSQVFEKWPFLSTYGCGVSLVQYVMMILLLNVYAGLFYNWNNRAD